MKRKTYGKNKKVKKTTIKTTKKTTKKNTTRKHLNDKNTLPVVYGKIHWEQCGHCQMLVPEWNIVKDKINIICYDIERNEETYKLPEFNNKYKPQQALQIQGGYPTIYKLPKYGGVIEYYQGQRDNQSILQWLHNNKN